MIKAIITACLMGFAVPALADDTNASQQFDSNDTGMRLQSLGAKRGDCVRAEALYYRLVKAIDENHYETVSIVDGRAVSHGIVETVKTKFGSTGRLGGISIKFVGSASLPTEDGFSARYALWQECKDNNHKVFP